MSYSPKDDGVAGVPGAGLPLAMAEAPSEQAPILEALRSAFLMAKDPEAVRRTRDRVYALVTFLDRLLRQMENPGRALATERGGLTNETGVDYVDGRVRTGLSPREIEIVKMLSQGQSVGSIAKALDLSPYTVRNHLKTCYRKVGVHTQIELMNHVFAHGLVTRP